MTNVPQILRAVPVLTKPADVEGDLAEILAIARDRLADRGRVLVRMSGTEPVVRVMVEADDADVAEVTAEELVSAVISRWGGREPTA